VGHAHAGDVLGVRELPDIPAGVRLRTIWVFLPGNGWVIIYPNPGHMDPLTTLRGYGQTGRDGRRRPIVGESGWGTARFGLTERGQDVGTGVGTEAENPELCIVNQ